MYEIIKKTEELISNAEPITGLTKKALSFGMKHFDDKVRERIEIFYLQLLDGDVSEEKIAYEEENIKATNEDYYQMLSAAINDEEKEKISIYTNLYKYIRANQKMPKSEKIRYIRMAKDLPYSAFQVLIILYIYYMYNTKEMTLNSYMQKIDKEHKFERNLLIQHDIFNNKISKMTEKEPSFSINEHTFYDVTATYFSIDELQPETHNIEIWKDKNVLILTDNVFCDGEDVNIIKNHLKDLSINPEVVSSLSALHNNSYSHIICIYKEIPQITKELIKLNNIETNTKLIKVSFAKSNNNNLSNAKDIFFISEMQGLILFLEQFSD